MNRQVSAEAHFHLLLPDLKRHLEIRSWDSFGAKYKCEENMASKLKW